MKLVVLVAICLSGLSLAQGPRSSSAKKNTDFSTRVSKPIKIELAALEESLNWAYYLDLKGDLDNKLLEYLHTYSPEYQIKKFDKESSYEDSFEYQKDASILFSPKLLQLGLKEQGIDLNKYLYGPKNYEWAQKYLIEKDSKIKFIKQQTLLNYLSENEELNSAIWTLAMQVKRGPKETIEDVVWQKNQEILSLNFAYTETFFYPLKGTGFLFLKEDELKRLNHCLENIFSEFDFEDEEELLLEAKNEYIAELNSIRAEGMIEVAKFFKGTSYRQQKFISEIVQKAKVYEEQIKYSSEYINNIVSDYPQKIKGLGEQIAKLRKDIERSKGSARYAKLLELNYLERKANRFRERVYESQELKKTLQTLNASSFEKLNEDLNKQEELIISDIDKSLTNDSYFSADEGTKLKTRSLPDLESEKSDLEEKKRALEFSKVELEDFAKDIAIASNIDIENRIKFQNNYSRLKYAEANIFKDYLTEFKSQENALAQKYYKELKSAGKNAAMTDYRVNLISAIDGFAKTHEKQIALVQDRLLLLYLMIEEAKLKEKMRLSKYKPNFPIDPNSSSFLSNYDELVTLKRRLLAENSNLKRVVADAVLFSKQSKIFEVNERYYELIYRLDKEDITATNEKELELEINELVKKWGEIEKSYKRIELAYNIYQRAKILKNQLPQILEHNFVTKASSAFFKGTHPLLKGKKMNLYNCSIEYSTSLMETDYYFVIDGFVIHKTTNYNELLLHITDHYPLLFYTLGCKSNVDSYASLGKWVGSSNYEQVRDAAELLLNQRFMPTYLEYFKEF